MSYVIGCLSCLVLHVLTMTTAHAGEGSILVSPGQLVRLGFERSRVVIMNEAHSGVQRCRRTREVGISLVPTLRKLGVRHLAMEALFSKFAKQANASRLVPAHDTPYLAQDDMRRFIQVALDHGLTLHAYEADMRALPSALEGLPGNHPSVVEFRETHQASNLTEVLAGIPPNEKLFVWCGGSHLAKEPIDGTAWMANLFRKSSGVEPFCIDQTSTVRSPGREAPSNFILATFSSKLEQLGGTGGLLTSDVDKSELNPAAYVELLRGRGVALNPSASGARKLLFTPGVDAYVFSLLNRME